jgi:hypothetical protein
MRILKVLIGCEESQTVCIEFRKLGHEAYSNDLKDCSRGYKEWHLKMDVKQAIDLYNWDLIGLHPVCTKMALSGNRTYAFKKAKYNERIEAVEWTVNLWEKAVSKCDFVYMENPMGAMNTDYRLPKPQIVQPYYFGDEAKKTTCLWLHGLPNLIHNETDSLFWGKTHVDKGEMVIFKSGKVMPKWYADTPSTKSEANRTIRSKTFPGIAMAMAEQWSNFILNT